MSYKITKDGLESLKVQLRKMKFEELPKIVEEIAEARDMGDLRENSEYQTARNNQTLINRRISDLEVLLNKAEVIDNPDTSEVSFGCTVGLASESGMSRKFKIVSEYESDVDNGLISDTSPIAQSLIGLKVGDFIEIGPNEFEVKSISA